MATDVLGASQASNQSRILATKETRSRAKGDGLRMRSHSVCDGTALYARARHH